MQAIVQREYGSPGELRLETVPKPAVEPGEVLVETHAASIHPDIWHVIRGRPAVLRVMGAGLRRPNCPIPGTDVAGVVEQVGEAVTGHDPGDAVFGETLPGLQWRNGGAFAEYVTAPADALVPKPDSLSFEAAAAVPTSGLIAHQGVQYQGEVEAGQHVLVNGAGGGVGTFAVQLANAYGARVTGVDSREKLELVEAIGAEAVVDYTAEDFTRRNEEYDLVLDIAGNHSFRACRRVLAADGRYVLIGHDHYGRVGRRVFGSLPRFVILLAASPFVSELSAMGFSSPPREESLATLVEFLESGAVTPVVDRTYPLAEVPQAIEYLSSGRVRGKVVVTIE